MDLMVVSRSSKIESLVGLAYRAGKVALGTAAVEEVLQKKKAKLLILSADISANTENHFVRLLENSGSQLLKTGTKRNWGARFGRKELAVLAILDVHFASGILEAVKE